MATWLTEHWTYLTGAASALLSLIGGWRFGPRIKDWCIARIAVETDLVYCRRENHILGDYIERMEKRLASVGLHVSDDGSD